MTKQEYRQLTTRSSRMEDKNIEDPYMVFDEYFNSFTLEESRNLLWNLYEYCVQGWAHDDVPSEEASKMLFFYTHTEMLLEATWLIDNKRKRKEQKK